ncbi:MAG: NADP-dependent phosphogluconate dehydrogenase [Desulfobacterales bacterium]|jgi:6-phosphogluconate dehydrogenase
MDPKCDIGIVGLGVMGRNLALNIADHGFAVAGCDLDQEKADSLASEKRDTHAIHSTTNLDQFVGILKRPRAVMLLVPAGQAVDAAIESLMPHLDADDLIIDAGNSNFEDTNRREQSISEKGLHYLGTGVSGGEKGARYGPSIMPGGSQQGYQRVKPILEAAAAKVNETPCVAYLGKGSAGHYVKIVHNGIEYGIMQLISETYDLMHRGLGYTAEQLARVYDDWNQGELNSFLVEITADIFRKKDDRTDAMLVEKILDCADQKGTGMWMACDALNIQEPIPTIDTAVQMRNLSMRKDQRRAGSEKLSGPEIVLKGDPDRWVQRLGRALNAGVIMTYGQGMAHLRRASETYGYGLDLSVVARIWRGGCIIRSVLLDAITAAFRKAPDLPNLLLDAELGGRVADRQSDLRHIVATAAAWGIPVPGFMASLAYFDAYRSFRLPANLIQAQRDYFGAHTYKRIDSEEVFHTQWQ